MGVNEFPGFCVRIAQLAVIVDATREEVVDETLLGLFELGDEPFRRADRLVRRFQDVHNPGLLVHTWKRDQGPRESPTGQFHLIR
jgi:hypothetical protein